MNELKNKDEESEYKLESFNRNVEEIVTPIEEQSLTAENKSIQDYDKEISEKVYQLHLGVASLDEEKDQKFEEDEGPYVDLEELKKKYGIKDEDIDYWNQMGKEEKIEKFYFDNAFSKEIIYLSMYCKIYYNSM